MGDIGPTQQRYEVLPSDEPVVVEPVAVVLEPVVGTAPEHEPEPRVRTSR